MLEDSRIGLCFAPIPKKRIHLRQTEALRMTGVDLPLLTW